MTVIVLVSRTGYIIHIITNVHPIPFIVLTHLASSSVGCDSLPGKVAETFIPKGHYYLSCLDCWVVVLFSWL